MIISAMEQKTWLLFVHYLLVAFVPLGTTFVLFKCLQGNIASYEQLPLGIKLGGPVASYAALYYLINQPLGQIFHTWREEDLHRRRLLETELSPSQALQVAERYAQLLARFIIVEVLLFREKGCGDDHFEFVMSIVRKRVIGFQNVVGSVTIRGGKYKLADVLGGAINNRDFHKKFEGNVAASLILSEHFLSNVRQSSTDINAFCREFESRMQEGNIDGAARFLAETNPASTPLSLQMLEAQLTDVLWKECENAINDPEAAVTTHKANALATGQGLSAPSKEVTETTAKKTQS